MTSAKSDSSTLGNIPSKPMRRVAFYSHDGFGLGHFRRCLLLASRIQDHLEDVEILLITGSAKATFFKMPVRTRVAVMEPMTKDSSGEYIPRNPQIDTLTAFRRRRDKLRKEILSFDPDLLIVDHVPTGLSGELIPLLPDLKSRGTRIAIGLRDIIDESETVRKSWKKSGANLLVESLYDHIWVYGSKDVFDLGKLYQLSETTNQRIEYLGYLKRISLSKLHTDFIDSLSLRRNSQKKIVCVAGGGEDGDPLGETFLQALSSFPNKYVGTLVTGPHLNRATARNLIDRFHQYNNIEILRFTTHLEDHLRAADVIVSMGGYNATLEAIAVRKPTIIIPRVSPRKEQWIRAQKFSQKGLINMIHPDELTTEKLIEAIETGLESPHLKTVDELGLNMDGIGNFLSRVDEILSTTIRKRKEEEDVNDTLLRA